MASGKRPAQFEGQGSEDEGTGNTSKRRPGISVLTRISVARDNKLLEKIVAPMIRNMVRQVLLAALERCFLLCPSKQRQSSLQLRFKESPGETYTGDHVKAKNKTSLEVALYQGEHIVTEGPMSSAQIKLCILQGSFGRRGDWSSEDFLRNQITKTRKGGDLLTGNLLLTLTNGVCTVEKLCVHDGSKWAESEKFRLGARVVGTTPETKNIREAISQPFRVKDCRGKSCQNHDTPLLNDEIWRLRDIGKNGIRHELLSSKGINTVEDFLHRLSANPNQLKQDLQTVGVTKKKWEKLVRHAEKAWDRQDINQPHHPIAPINLEPQNLVLAGQVFPHYEHVAATLQGSSVPSTSTSHFDIAVNVGQVDAMDDDLDFNLDEFLIDSPNHEEHNNYESSCPNFGGYMASRGGCTTIWSKIRSVFKTTRAFLHLKKAKTYPQQMKKFSID